jgi:septal ring factor EnvC (AmiA/AmiB activator)
MRKQIVPCFLLGIWVNEGQSNIAEKSNELNEVQVNINALQQEMQRIQLEQKILNIQLAEIEKDMAKQPLY